MRQGDDGYERAQDGVGDGQAATVDPTELPSRRTGAGLVKRLALASGLLVALTGCTPWIGLPSVWGGATRTIVDDPYSQLTVDSGAVTNWSGCWPGDGCTVHLAAHRSSHGSTFAKVPRLRPGDPIDVSHDGTTYRFVVDSLQVVERATGSNALIVGDLVLQTSHRNPARIYLVYATMVSPAG